MVCCFNEIVAIYYDSRWRDIAMTKTKDVTRDVERFDKWSSSYDQSWMQSRFFDKVHQQVLQVVAETAEHKPPVTILDIGCGTGKLLHSAQALWPHSSLVGVDAAEGMIEVARRRLPDDTFYNSVAEHLPLPDASVDVAISTISFHHWQDQEQGLREVARVLQPGGYFFLADIALPVWLALVVRGTRFHSRAELRTYFERTGFQVRKQQSVYSRHVIVTVGERGKR
jgi:ubiquinone/menaquinone biosynthesis C-methylase UbiE